MRRVALIAAAAIVVASQSGCAAAHKPSRRLKLAPDVVINFKNVHDGKCKVRDIELDAKTGTQTVICKDQPEEK
jgi:Spy/CpxP family protein refolding chaperone